MPGTALLMPIPRCTYEDPGMVEQDSIVVPSHVPGWPGWRNILAYMWQGETVSVEGED